MGRRLLLLCGILSPLLYAMSDAICGLRYDGYSFRDQTISELNAIGAPTRTLSIAFGLATYAAFVAFGVGVPRSAEVDRRWRTVSVLIVVFGVVALFAVPFASMNPRGTDQGLRGAAHIGSLAVALPIILTIMAFAAAAGGARFRLYTLITVALLLAFGAWSGADGSKIADGLDTPWTGVKERISVYSYQLWFAVLALALLRRGVGDEASRGSRAGTHTSSPLTTARA